MSNELFFDIETIPCQAPDSLAEFRAAVTPPGTYKKQDSIDVWLHDNRDAEGEKAWLNTSFDGGLGQICVIGWALDDEEPCAYVVDDLSPESEIQALEDFFCAVTDAGAGLRFVGHNVIDFDLPFIWKRAMVLGVKPPRHFPRNPRPWGESVADTMLLWDQSQRAGGSMERLCKLLGIPGKGGMDGSQVWPMVRDGRIDEVGAYCAGDVSRTRAMYRRMTFAPIEP